MTLEIEKKFRQILNELSEREKSRNLALAQQTMKVLVAIEYLKATLKNKAAV